MLKKILYFFTLIIAALTFSFSQFAATAQAQDDPASVMLNRYVENPDGSLNEKTPPQVSFTAFLNADLDSVLLETAPRWSDDLPNLRQGQGNFTIELGNFPQLSSGDSAYVRFTDNEIGAQGVLQVAIDTIPWSDPNPLGRLVLQEANVPSRPDSLELSSTGSGELTLSWRTEAGLTYSVYRRSRQDTVFNGESRRLYTRLDSGLTSGSYVDNIEGDPTTYAYMVYAQNSSGVYSSHSEEIVISRPITGVTADSTATTVQLHWDPYQPLVGQLGGYQIYRRTENGSYGNPIAYASTDTTYTDTRLTPGTTYYYKIEARNLNQDFFGLSDEVSITTDSDTSPYYKYATLKMAAIIYKKTATGSITDADVESIKKQYERTRKFYWRNSGLKLNIEMDYFVVQDKVNISEVSISNVADQLRDRGVYNTQYDLVFAAWPIDSGFWSIGDGATLSLPGPSRNTGFAQTQLPCGNGVGYPIEPGEERCATWTYMHENQHTIGAIYGRMGTPMMHGDFPQAFYYPAGMHLDFQASMFRVFDNYLNLHSGWGDIYEARDSDGDDFPDHDPRAPFNEEDFGSDPTSADTDGDGLNDHAEAMDGNYWGSNPNLADTDGDSIPDGQDSHPRYPIEPYIKKLPDTVSINVDGNLSEWNQLDARVSRGMDYVFTNNYNPVVHMTYSSDWLYIALDLPDVGLPEFRFDFEGDGRWHGAGNTRVGVNITEGGSFDEFRSWDARQDVRRFVDENPDDEYPGNGMWDNTSAYQEEFRRYVFNEGAAKVASSIDWPRVDVELALPRNPDAGLHLVPGDSIGWNINYGKINNEPGNWGTTFDQHGFVYFDLIDKLATSVEEQKEVAHEFNLKPNYPNPFNPSTQISYSIPQTGNVSLKVYDLLGREVATLVDGVQKAGNHKVRFEAGNLSSGIYFYRLRAAGKTQVHKMTLMK